jgi:intracellular sulfur oxidation DsrE/DsrF family protein
MKATITLLLSALVTITISADRPDTANPQYQFPLIKKAGGVVPLPQAAEQPRPGGKVVLDITGRNKADKVTKGVDRAGVILNLHVSAGIKPDQLEMVIILHGPATRAALHHEAYAKRTEAGKNPNLAVFRELAEAGVEVYVCGQALAHQQIGLNEVAEEVTIAASASTVLISRQRNGYAYIPFH